MYNHNAKFGDALISLIISNRKTYPEIFEGYKIPSSSLSPVLITGDYVYVSIAMVIVSIIFLQY